MVTAAKVTFDVDIRRASYFLDIHPSVHAGTREAPKLALRELPRGAVVFASEPEGFIYWDPAPDIRFLGVQGLACRSANLT